MITLPNVFAEVVALLLLAAVVGAVALRLRQPLIVGFIGVGIIAGTSVLGLTGAVQEIELLAELGLSLLLFVVGLKLDLKLIRSMGTVALATGLGQVAFTSAFGYLIALGLGMPPITALYVAVALTFSSTIIIVKLLSDKRETDSLHGRIAVGLLIVQDILVILAMIGLTAFAGQGQADVGLHALIILGRGMALLAGVGLLMFTVLPRLVGALAKSAELLVLFAIAWAMVVASLSDYLGFSKEVGAFLAGVSLASTPYREVLGARLVSLRDFLLLFFFIDLGMSLDLGLLGGQVWSAIPVSAFVLIGNPLIVMVIMGIMGYRKRTSFLTGLTVAQISEFSLILAALGLRLGQIDAGTVGLITLVGLITIGLSTYMILYSQRLYEWLSPYLGVFERRFAYREQVSDAPTARSADVILFGLGRYGTGIGERLIERGHCILGVDFDPQAVRSWNETGGNARFGDAEDPEFPSMLPLSQARWVLSSIPVADINLSLVRALRGHQYLGSIAVTAHNQEDEHDLLDAGADLVLRPFPDAAEQAVDKWEIADREERRRRMDKIIAGISDHYIICGYGRMGQQIAKDLEHQGQPYVVIESNPEQMPKLTDIPHVEGKASEDKTLIAAGIERAKGLIAVNATDEENVFIVLSAKGLNPKLFIVARSILQENEDKLRKAGADKVVSPYVLGGHLMASAVLTPYATEFLDLIMKGDHSDLEFADLPVTSRAPFTGKAIRGSKIRETTGVLVLGIRRPGEEPLVNPDPDTLIREGDQLIVMGTSAQVYSAEKLAAGD